MPDNSVTTSFFANDKDAVAAIARLEKKYEDLIAKTKHAAHASKEHSHGSLEHVTELGKAIGGMAIGFTSLEGALDKVLEATAEWRKEADAAAMSIDKANRSFAVRTGGPGETGKEFLEKARVGADVAGISHADAEQLFGDLANRGFSHEDVAKNFPTLAGEFATSRTATGVDSAGFADAVLKLLARDAPKNADTLGQSARDVFNLTRGSRMSAEDIGSFGEILQTSAGGKAKERHAAALAKMGMVFADVDMIGEDFATVIKRLRAGMQKLKIEDRMPVLKELTGDAGMANRVMSAIDKQAGNETVHDELLREQTSGLAAGKQRAENRKHEIAAAAGGDIDIRLDAAEMISRQSGANPALIAMARKMAGMLHGANVPDDIAIGTAFQTPGGVLLDKVVNGDESFLNRVDAQTKLLQEGLETQKRIADALEAGDEQREEIKDKAKGKPRRGGDE